MSRNKEYIHPLAQMYIKSSIVRFAEFAMEVNTDHSIKTEIFFDIYPHVQQVHVRVFIDGWYSEAEPDVDLSERYADIMTGKSKCSFAHEFSRRIDKRIEELKMLISAQKSGGNSDE